MKKPQQTALVVEDDPEVRKLVRKYLEKLELTVVEVANGRAAVAVLADLRPDLVCLDLMLPEFSGYQVCKFIRETAALRNVPVLVISARSLPEDRAHAEELGASAYLIKPFSRTECTRHVAALLPSKTAP